MPNGKKTKTGYSTAADVLERLAPDYPIVSEILEYRQLTKLKSTYADGLALCIASDGRIHSTFNQTITATGRISSTEPNLQNIPIRMELGRLIRKVFVPKDGYVFIDADYSQIELRVLAHMSGDQNRDRSLSACRRYSPNHCFPGVPYTAGRSDRSSETKCKSGKFWYRVWYQFLRSESGSEYYTKRSRRLYRKLL